MDYTNTVLCCKCGVNLGGHSARFWACPDLTGNTFTTNTFADKPYIKPPPGIDYVNLSYIPAPQVANTPKAESWLDSFCSSIEGKEGAVTWGR